MDTGLNILKLADYKIPINQIHKNASDKLVRDSEGIAADLTGLRRM